MPMWAATRLAPSSSPLATEGETAVTALAWSPSARYAIAATTDESTPPQNATTAWPSAATRASSRSSMGLTHCLPPDHFHRGVGDAGGALAVGVLGGEVDDLAFEAADLDPHRFAGDLDREEVP